MNMFLSEHFLWSHLQPYINLYSVKFALGTSYLVYVTFTLLHMYAYSMWLW